MRKEFPNAYKPWSEAEDNKLKFQFATGAGVKAMSDFFGRHPGSIRSRLKKHFGEDISLLK